MISLKKVFLIFSSMPRREKIAIVLLTAVFIISIGHLVISEIRFPINTEKGIFAEGMVGHINNLNPLFVDFNDTDRDLSRFIFSGLMKYDPIKKNSLPDLAEKWERSKNGLIYTFILRPNAYWHDGKPVNTDDILFTFKDVIQAPSFRNPILRNAFEGVTVAISSANTITFTLTKPNSYFISYLTVGILPKHILENTNIPNFEKSSFGTQPIGSGPYEVSGLKLSRNGDYIDLIAFDKYYGEKPLIQQMRFFAFPDETTLIKHASALHAVSKLGIATDGIKTLSSDIKFTVYPYTLNQFTALYLNTTNPLLNDKAVRQALALGLNKQALLQEGEQRVDTLEIADNSTDARFAFNLETASKALDNLGFKKDQDGFRVSNKGEKISLKLLTLDKISQSLLDAIKNQWETLGIQIQIEKVKQQDFYNFISERRYDVLLIRQNLGYNRDVYPLFHSSQILTDQTKNGLNFSNFKSFRTDGITEAIRKEKDSQGKQKLFEELSRVIAEEIPIIFLSTPVYAYALDKRVQQFPTNSLDYHSDRLAILPYSLFQNL